MFLTLKSSFPPSLNSQVLMVRFASLFNVVERTVMFLSGKRYSLDTLRSLGAGELLNSMCEFSEKLAALRLDQDEMSLFTAVVLVSAGEENLQLVCEHIEKEGVRVNSRIKPCSVLQR